LGTNKLEQNEVQFNWQDLKLMMMKMGCYDKVGDPISLFRWKNIGLERKIYNQLNYGWVFKVVDKQKFTHAVIKYDLLSS
jgi:hypothetical protein